MAGLMFPWSCSPGDFDGAPLLLLSDLAEHSRNLARDARLALLVDGTPATLRTR